MLKKKRSGGKKLHTNQKENRNFFHMKRRERPEFKVVTHFHFERCKRNSELFPSG